MDVNQFSIIIQAVLEKSGITKDLSEIQKIINNNMIKIIPQLETSSLKNNIKSISNLIASSLNEAYRKAGQLDINIKGSDVAKVLTASLKSMNTTIDASSNKIQNLANSMLAFKQNNSNMTRAMKKDLDSMYNSLINGANISESELKELQNRFSSFKLEVRDAGRLGRSASDSIRSGMASFATWLPASQIIMTGINSFRKAIDNVVALDTALVDLKKTANMSASELENFYYTANETAKQMGVTTEEILNQAAAWSRLGFNTAEAATQMAKYSSMFSIISPGLDLDSATDGLVSIMKAFKIGLEDTNEVVDGIMSKINIIGNTRALNNSDIVEFLTRSSAAMAEANNTLEDTIALGTAITEITRDAASAGQVLKTVSMRIRGYDEQTEEYIGGVEELSGEIANLTKTASTPGGISLFTDEAKTEYKSTRELFGDIAKIYDQLNDKTQAQLLEALAGKRNGQAVAAILNNYEAVEDSLNSMANSAGNAEAEMAIAMDSVAYKANITKETATGIAQNLFGREDMKTFLDAVNTIGKGLDWLTERLGLFGTVAPGAFAFLNKGRSKQRFCPVWG